MTVAEIRKSKTNKEKKDSAEKQKERREERLQGKRDRNVAVEYGRARKVNWLPRLRYRVVLINTGKPGKPRADISGLVTSVSWDEEGVTLTGAITVRAPKQLERKDREFTVSDGNIVRLDAHVGSRWIEIWQMRVEAPSDDLAGGEGTFVLADDSKIAAASSGDFKYKKEKKSRPKGWKAHEIVIDVCRRYKIPLGHVVKGTKDITNLVKHDVSPLDIIAAAYKQERDWTGTRFLFSWRNGKLNITKLRRNPLLYALRDQLTGAVVERQRGEKFFTAMEVTASLKDGKRKHKKVEAVVVSHKAARRYGYIVIKHDLKKHVKSRQEAIDIARRILARSIKKHTQPTINISHPDIPWVRRGDAIEILLPEYGFTPKPRPVPPFEGGSFDILFIRQAHHSVDSSGYSMELEFTTDDPVAEQKKEQRDARDERRREEKRKERKEKDKDKK
jgi:hypothetical protein